MKKLLCFVISLAFCFNAFGQSSTVLEQLISDVKFIDQQTNPNLSLWNGLHPDEIIFIQLDEYFSIQDKYRRALKRLEAIPKSSLDHQEQISKAVMRLKLNDHLSHYIFKKHLVPFNSEGGFYNSPAYFLPNLPFDSLSDFKAYVHWLPSFAPFIESHINLMRLGIEQNSMVSKLVVEKNLMLLHQWVNTDVSRSPFYKPLELAEKLLSNSEFSKIDSTVQVIIRTKILPAYQKFYDFLKNEYLSECKTSIGIGYSDAGKAYYENRLSYYATMPLEADSVFNLGKLEVKRIRKKMDSIITLLEFRGDWDEFLTFLRNSPQFYAKTPEELLNRAKNLSSKAELKLPLFFSHLYKLPYVVEAVPEEIAPNYTSGRYVHGDITKQQPGKYWVNTYNLPSRTLYTLPALTLHEAIPGHHLQTTIASEAMDLPEFRSLYYISAFGEGWALYCEYLGEEMGMYSNAYELFGRYTYEMWRACRLVVDVGIHYKGWSRDRAVNYLSKNTALSIHEVNTEIDRYIGWPGQAISYKIGEIVIKDLRIKAEKALGDQFDIREFHYRILRNGSVPLPVLISEIDLYIQGFP